MSEPTVRITLTEKDLSFISESISQNVPSDEHMTPEEKETKSRIDSALFRARTKSE